MTTPPLQADIDVVLFDVGGVLVQLNGMETLREWVGSCVSVDELWVRWLRSASVRRFETGQAQACDFAIEVTREFGLAMAPEQFLDSFERWPLGLYPGAMEMLALIPMRYRRALLSNSNALHWPRLLNDLGLGTTFAHHFVSHLTGKIKPDPEAFDDVVRSLACAPEQVLFLDDNLLNVEAAASFGMHAARVHGPREAQRTLTEFGIIGRCRDA